MFPPKDSECECVCAGLGVTARTIQDQRNELHMRKRIYAYQRQEIQVQWLGKQSFWSGGRDHVSLLCVAKRNLSLYWLCPRKPQSQVTQVSEHSGKRWAPCRLRATFPDDTWRLPWGSGPPWTAAIFGGVHLCPHKVWQILLPAHLERSQGFLKEHYEPQGNQGDVPFLTMCHGTERLGQWEVAPTIASDEEKWKEQQRDTTKREWAWKNISQNPNLAQFFWPSGILSICSDLS